jgi:hypothetical protein
MINAAAFAKTAPNAISVLDWARDTVSASWLKVASTCGRMDASRDTYWSTASAFARRKADPPTSPVSRAAARSDVAAAAAAPSQHLQVALLQECVTGRDTASNDQKRDRNSRESAESSSHGRRPAARPFMAPRPDSHVEHITTNCRDSTADIADGTVGERCVSNNAHRELCAGV